MPTEKRRDDRYKKREFERAAKDGDFYDREYLRKKYPGWELNDSTVLYDDDNGWRVYLKMRRIITDGS